MKLVEVIVSVASSVSRRGKKFTRIHYIGTDRPLDRALNNFDKRIHSKTIKDRTVSKRHLYLDQAQEIWGAEV